jgi:hypothetical protein
MRETQIECVEREGEREKGSEREKQRERDTHIQCGREEEK